MERRPVVRAAEAAVPAVVAQLLAQAAQRVGGSAWDPAAVPLGRDRSGAADLRSALPLRLAAALGDPAPAVADRLVEALRRSGESSSPADPAVLSAVGAVGGVLELTLGDGFVERGLRTLAAVDLATTDPAPPDRAPVDLPPDVAHAVAHAVPPRAVVDGPPAWRRRDRSNPVYAAALAHARCVRRLAQPADDPGGQGERAPLTLAADRALALAALETPAVLAADQRVIVRHLDELARDILDRLDPAPGASGVARAPAPLVVDATRSALALGLAGLGRSAPTRL